MTGFFVVVRSLGCAQKKRQSEQHTNETFNLLGLRAGRGARKLDRKGHFTVGPQRGRGNWATLEFVDVMIHVMRLGTYKLREFYRRRTKQTYKIRLLF